MPKIGMEPLRKRELIQAAIAEIHLVGSLEVTVGNIARRAGVSSALAHHYFGHKDDLIIAVMRHLLRELGRRLARDLRAAEGPRARLSAIIAANFSPDQFGAETISAWLNFYVKAQRSSAAARLLRVYTARMRSNLLHELDALVAPGLARGIADGIGAMIDGVYLRHALPSVARTAAEAIEIVEDYVALQLAAQVRAGD